MPSSNVCWGIDIGAGAIKAIRLERDGDAARVSDFVVVPHKRVLSTPDIVEAEAVRVALGSFLGEYRDQLRGASVVCSLPGHATFARFAKLPPVEAKGVENLVKFEAVQQIPFPSEEVEWDYQVFASEDPPEVEVGIFAVTRDRVNEKLSLWGETGLNPDEITLGPVAAYNAIAYDLEFTESSPGTVIVDIGAVATDLIIAERGRVWIRTFPIGGHHFTEVLAETFKLDYRKAEKLKLEAETSKYKRHIFQALKPILTDLVQDVQRSISYYSETHPNAKLERVIGLGSTFKLLGLRKLMSQQLGMDVYRLEGFKRTNVEGSAAVEFDSVSLNMATAYGLALQGLGMTPIDANLVPTGITRETMWRAKTPYFVAAAVIGLIGGASTFVQPLLDSSQTSDFGNDPSVRSLKSQYSALQTSWREIEEQNRLSFLPSNADALVDPEPKTVHLKLVRDAIGGMLEQATDDNGRPIYRAHSFLTDYLAPGEELTGGPVAQRGAGNRD
ncbi:MAG: type IV pilus assembly protein PilM, partial [Planctomycetota bacterium]